MSYEVIVDTALTEVAIGGPESETESKTRLLGLINDYESKSWRYQRFSDFVWNNIALTSLSARERESLSDEAMTQLSRSAMALRLIENDRGGGSEIAEIVLYALMRKQFKALPVVPKIFYKQNRNDNAKGADSVHIVLAQSQDDFTLWLGEAKFYSDINDARLEKVIESVSDLLSTQKIRKENSIILGLSDLDSLVCDSALRAKIRATLADDRSIDTLKPRLHVPILLLHQCSITSEAEEINEEYLTAIRDHFEDRAARYFDRQSVKLSQIPGYEHIHFHLMVFPVPCKKSVIERFVSVAKNLRGECS